MSEWLTHWPLGDFNFRYVIFKLTLVNGGWGIAYEIALRWMPLDLSDDKSTLVQVRAWCRQATSHYLSQCWPRSMSPNGITRPHWVKFNCLPRTSMSITAKLVEPYKNIQPTRVRAVFNDISIKDWKSLPELNQNGLIIIVLQIYLIYHQTSNISHILVGNKIVDHSDVVGASPVGAAPTTSSFSI